jgi:hypothetical protein
MQGYDRRDAVLEVEIKGCVLSPGSEMRFEVIVFRGWDTACPEADGPHMCSQ